LVAKIRRSDPAAERQDAGDTCRRARLYPEAGKDDQDSEAWQTAAQALLLVADQNGPTLFAPIGLMLALYPAGDRVFNPDAKSHHWGKRKLVRDR
jgi:hypothetical protein